jgi:hypothetical protein
MGGASPELGKIRADFIRAAIYKTTCAEADTKVHATRELRKYFGWFAETLSEYDRFSITSRLLQLECGVGTHSTPEIPPANRPDRVDLPDSLAEEAFQA